MTVLIGTLDVSNIVSDISESDGSRVNPVIIPGSHKAASIDEVPRVQKRINLRMFIQDTSADALRATVSNLMHRLEGTVDVYYPHNDRFVSARLLNVARSFPRNMGAMKGIDLSLGFISGDESFWKSASQASLTITGIKTDATFSFKNTGGAPAWLIFGVTSVGATLKGFTLRQSGLGNIFSNAYTLLNGSVMTFDGDTERVRISGTDKIGQFSGDFLRAIKGTNVFRFTGTIDPTSGSTTMKILYTRRWY